MKGREDVQASVYVVINSVNGKRYIGVTRFSLRRRLREHFSEAKRGLVGGMFKAAIRKYGPDAFTIETLAIYPDAKSAVAGEIEFIAVLKPEYNSTKGGDGQLGRIMSAKGRAKISAAGKGNKRRLGMTHSPETKARLRGLGLQNKDKWAEFASMGPKALSRKVICVDDGVVYDSASAAARAYGSAKSAIIELCLGKNYRKTVNGRVFKYLET